MINEQAANASRTAKTLTALYTRLDIARDCITLAIDQLPKDFDIHQTGRINDIRNTLSREMSRIWDLRESEERRLCEQPPEPTDSSPADNQKMPMALPDDLDFSNGPIQNHPSQILPPDPTFIQINSPGLP